MKKNKLRQIVSATILLTAFFGITSCSSDGPKTGENNSNAKELVIMGAGSSFDYPLFSKMFHEYHEQFGQKVNYQSIGSGAGISQLTHKTVDFGASDAPMKVAQEEEAKTPVLHIPVTAGAVVVSYNLPEVGKSLKFSPAVLANIFLGEVTKWNDARIVAENPGVVLPAKAIIIARRSDGSGTTSIFTDYLSKVSTAWRNKVGQGTAVKWPVGLGGKGNEGVAGLIKQTPGALGYIELAYAIQNKMAYASIQNKAGNFIMPTIESVSAAAKISLPEDGKVSLTNTEAALGYPISGFSWVIIYKELSDNNNSVEKAKALVTLLKWMIHDGQQYSAALDYAPLSEEAVLVGTNLLKTVTYKGQPVLQDDKK